MFCGYLVYLVVWFGCIVPRGNLATLYAYGHVYLHVFRQLHQDGVAVDVLDGEHALEVDAELCEPTTISQVIAWQLQGCQMVYF
jgi:hypothetical protein